MVTSVTIVARGVRNISFVLLLAAVGMVVTQHRVEAFPGCDPTPNYSNYTLWYWACGNFGSDPCPSIDSACGYDCYSYFNRQAYPSVYSCVSGPRGDGTYWLSWAECYCPE